MKLKRAPKQPAGRQRQRREPNDTPQPGAYSYHAARAQRNDDTSRQQSSLADKRSRLLAIRQWARRSSTITVVIIAAIIMLVVIGLSTKPSVVLVDSGNTYAFSSADTYKAAVQKQLSSSIWNRNKITFNAGALAASLQSDYPELSRVDVSLPLIGQTPTVYLEANTPAFVMQTQNGTFVLDARGKALSSKDAAPPELVATLPTITDQTGIQVRLGKQIISSANADFVQQVVASLKTKQITVESLVLPSNNVQELDVRVSGKPYVIKFDMHDSRAARQQIGTYLATQQSLEQQGKTPTQYIDVRVLGRVYYQ